MVAAYAVSAFLGGKITVTGGLVDVRNIVIYRHHKKSSKWLRRTIKKVVLDLYATSAVAPAAKCT